MLEELIAYFVNLEPWWMVPIVLALFALFVAVPIRCVISGYSYKILHKKSWFIVLGPVVEEVFFRLIALMFLIELFGTLPAIAIMSIGYAIYMGLVYGPSYSADGLILGAFFSFAFLEFGFLTILAAHIIYRSVSSVW